MNLSFRLFFSIAGLGTTLLAVPNQATTTPEDSRLTFIKGLLSQISARIQFERKATVPEIALAYEERLVVIPTELTDDEMTKLRRQKLGVLVEAIAQLTRNGVSQQTMFAEVRLAKPSEERLNLGVVIWLFRIPANLKTDQPQVKAVKWSLILIDQNQVDGVDGQPPKWRFLDLAKELLTTIE